MPNFLQKLFRRSRPIEEPKPTPAWLKDWQLLYCPIHEVNWMYMPNEPNNRECPQCQDDRARNTYSA